MGPRSNFLEEVRNWFGQDVFGFNYISGLTNQVTNQFLKLCCSRYVWPWAIKDSIGHDAYYCQKYNNTKPFPTKRKIGANNFVGSAPSYNMTAEPCLSYEFCHPDYDHPCSCTCDLNE